MSLVSPPEFADVKDSPDKSTVLIATVQEDEPVVTRKELWSYYRAYSLREFPSLFTVPNIVYYNGDNVSPCSISSHSPHPSPPTGCRSSRLYPNLVPKPRYCRWLRSNRWTRLVLSFQYCLGTMCPPLDGWYQTHRECRPRCEWHQLCDHDGHIHHHRLRCRLWYFWSLALVHRDPHLLGCPICLYGTHMYVPVKCVRCCAFNDIV